MRTGVVGKDFLFQLLEEEGENDEEDEDEEGSSSSFASTFSVLRRMKTMIEDGATAAAAQ